MLLPAILKVLIVFALMLLMARCRVQLGLAIAAGGLVLNLWAGRGASVVAADLARALANPELWLFVIITALIIEVGRYLTEGRNSEEILAATRRWGGRHGATCTLMAVPAVIGLIPMPAGALFSAPFVQQAGKTIRGRPEWKAAVNYWFRHVWEYWWPLYPGVIIGMSVFEMDSTRFIATQILYTPVALLAGYVFLVHPHVRDLAAEQAPGSGSNRRALFLLMPLAIVVTHLLLMPFWLEWSLPAMGVQYRKMVSLLVGLLAALGLIAWDMKQRPRTDTGGSPQVDNRMFSSLFEKKSLNVLCTLAGVLVFKSLLKASGLLPLAGKELVTTGIPLVVVVAGLPFLAGLITGIAIGFAGTSFPLVVGLMGAADSGLTTQATLVLAFGFGYMGMIVSPVHLCLLVTNDYFSADIVRVLKRILPCVLVILGFCVAFYNLLRLLNW